MAETRINEQAVRRLIKRLRAVSGDQTLICRQVWQGSMELMLEGSVEALDKLVVLHRKNELSSRLDQEVISLLRPKTANVITRTAVRKAQPVLAYSAPPAPPGGDSAPPAPFKPKNPTLKQALRSFRRRYVEQALEYNRWNVSATARQLGIARSHLYALMESHGLSRRSRK